MKPGFHNISNEEYQKDSAVSKTDLQLFQRSPAHYKAKEFKEPTPAMIFGEAVHTAVLQPELYAKRYISLPEGVTRVHKRGKEMALEAQEKGQTLLSFDDVGKIAEMRKSIQAHETASKLIYQEGPAEISGFWTDKATGLECKCRPDKILSLHGIIVELKTTEDARLEPFQKSIVNYRYYWQGYWYLTGVSQITNISHTNFVIVAIEKEPPYAVAVYRLDDAMIYLAGEEIKPLLQQFKQCKDNDHWPAYHDEIEPISLPDWYYKKAQI